jgi:hypothetical protein
MENKTKPNAFVWLLIVLQFLLGIGAFFSGLLMMLFPNGNAMQMPLSLIESSPFHNFFIPGLLLCLFVGVYPLGVAYSLWKRPGWTWPEGINPFKKYHWSWAGSLAAAVIVIIWLSVELIWVPYSILHAIYYVWAGVILLLTLLPSVKKYLWRAS